MVLSSTLLAFSETLMMEDLSCAFAVSVGQGGRMHFFQLRIWMVLVAVAIVREKKGLEVVLYVQNKNYWKIIQMAVENDR